MANDRNLTAKDTILKVKDIEILQLNKKGYFSKI